MFSFGRNMYYWRRLSHEDREQVLALRKARYRPWHSPPHATGQGRYMLTAACYEHAPIIGWTLARMTEFEDALLTVLDANATTLHAWAVLPNHYHALVSVKDVEPILLQLGRLHGRTAFAWNAAEQRRGRQVWCGTVETRIKSDRHFHASLNYVHHNPVKHGCAEKWTDWPFSSAASYLRTVGREKAEKAWREYDISDMGGDWDP
jgi:putative transposase